nr:hypothetical protein [Tanacetum cinerariifolium]
EDNDFDGCGLDLLWRIRKSRTKALVIEGGQPRQRLEVEEGGDDWKNGVEIRRV